MELTTVCVCVCVSVHALHVAVVVEVKIQKQTNMGKKCVTRRTSQVENVQTKMKMHAETDAKC